MWASSIIIQVPSHCTASARRSLCSSGAQWSNAWKGRQHDICELYQHLSRVSLSHPTWLLPSEAGLLLSLRASAEWCCWKDGAERVGQIKHLHGPFPACRPYVSGRPSSLSNLDKMRASYRQAVSAEWWWRTSLGIFPGEPSDICQVNLGLAMGRGN